MLNNEVKKELNIVSEKKITLNERGRQRKEIAAAGIKSMVKKTVDLITLMFEDNFEKSSEKVSTTGKSTQPIWFVRLAAGKLEGLDENLRVIELGKESANAPKAEVIRFLELLSDENFLILKEELDNSEGLAAKRGETEYIFYLKDDEDIAEEITLS